MLAAAVMLCEKDNLASSAAFAAAIGCYLWELAKPQATKAADRTKNQDDSNDPRPIAAAAAAATAMAAAAAVVKHRSLFSLLRFFHLSFPGPN